MSSSFSTSRRPLWLPVLLFLVVFVAATQSANGRPSQSLFRRHGATDSHDHEREEEVDCYASGVEDWNTGLHIGAVFIILAAGGLGSYLPVLARYVPQLRIPQTLLTLGKFLGTGVIIATALIHMLPAGSESLGNPCIGDRLGNYGGWPGVLAMMAIFAMHLMEFLLTHHAMDKHTHGHQDADVVYKDLEAGGSHTSESLVPPAGHGHGHSHGSRKLSMDEASQTADAGAAQDAGECDAVAVHTHHTHVHGLPFISADNTSSSGSQMAAAHHRHRVSTYILELGICLHSVIIGLTLSVTTGTDFKTLLVAICFHQFCEGLALGSRIAQMQYKRLGFVRAAANAAAFMLVTPLGMAIGIGVRHSYQPNSPGALITMGVLDSLSAGILIYTGLVNLLAEEFGSLEFRNFGRLLKAACFAACFVGAGIMALIGKWA
ncbi:hypothetical protein LPJ53_003753 [Coemansia erecta]|uniref:Zinc/iron permease n=1 Tax=Coemansia erecta TaxID=147472 RepID=A0A9W8CRN3_9FUNG|nr:hypothetical protein LPJ53_003753 [Coemansia erecta]